MADSLTHDQANDLMLNRLLAIVEEMKTKCPPWKNNMAAQGTILGFGLGAFASQLDDAGVIELVKTILGGIRSAEKQIGSA